MRNLTGTLSTLFLILLIASCKKDNFAIPTLTTTEISSINLTTAVSGGNITNDNGASITDRGVCWSVTQNPTILDNKSEDGIGIGVFTSTITGLTQGTTYYVRAYATNKLGTAYGSQVSFTSLALPTLNTSEVELKTQSSILSGGKIISDGGSSITARGVCWSTSPIPTETDNKTVNGTGTGDFLSSVSDLSVNTLYYIRAYATNIGGTGYGPVKAFVLWMNVPGPKVTDIDGNTYNSIKLGSQIWFAENLKTTKYSNGTSIPLVNTISS
jgi:hypothetical protein